MRGLQRLFLNPKIKNPKKSNNACRLWRFDNNLVLCVAERRPSLEGGRESSGN